MEIEVLARRAAQRQLDAYNAHDVEAFVACYSEDVELFDLKSSERTGPGHGQLRADYKSLFARSPNIHARVTTRTIVGNMVFDHEIVTGLGHNTPVLYAMAIYEVSEEGLIQRAWFVTA